MNNHLSIFVLGSILLFNSIVSSAGILLGSDLVDYSAVAGAALNISVDSLVTNELGALAAIGIGARTDTANLYSDKGAVNTGDGGKSGNIYAGAAVSIATNATVKNVYAAAAVTLGASGKADSIYSAAAITLGALSTSQYVYAASVITGDGANSKTAFTVTAPIIGLYEENFDIDGALEQLNNAQKSLLSLKNYFNLDVGYGSNTFESGVWKGSAVTIAADALIQFDGKGEENPIWVFNLDSALVVGAGAQFEIINAGAGASILWNLGGSLSLGNGTSFVGTAFVTGAVTGATSEVSCGNLFAKMAIGIGSMISTNCPSTDTWAGSVNGLGYGVDISNGIISNQSSSPTLFVSEPSTVLIFSSLTLMLFVTRLKHRQLFKYFFK
jgi:hypothetical protein